MIIWELIIHFAGSLWLSQAGVSTTCFQLSAPASEIPNDFHNLLLSIPRS